MRKTLQGYRRAFRRQAFRRPSTTRPAAGAAEAEIAALRWGLPLVELSDLRSWLWRPGPRPAPGRWPGSFGT